MILDAAEQKGTGRWTAQNALELGVPLTGITEAVFARTLSALKDERVARRRAARRAAATGTADAQLGDDLEHALYASKIVSYAQGFAQMAAAADDEGWNIDLGSMATIWRGGCIIRARFLDRIREAYDDRARAREPDAGRVLRARARARPRIRGGGSSPSRPSSASRRRPSRRRSPTTTATAARADPRA